MEAEILPQFIVNHNSVYLSVSLVRVTQHALATCTIIIEIQIRARTQEEIIQIICTINFTESQTSEAAVSLTLKT